MPKLAFFIRIDHLAEMRALIGAERMHAIQRQLFGLVRSACRSSDMVHSFRENECGAVVSVKDVDNGALLADRIQERVRSHIFEAGDGLDFGLTCSIGFSAHPMLDDNPNRVTWIQTIKLALNAVDTASGWSEDAWFGYLGSNGPPLAAPGAKNSESQPDDADRPSLPRSGFVSRDSAFRKTDRRSADNFKPTVIR